MISKQEILTTARKLNLLPSTIEKDYVLGWFLKGITNQKEIGNTWIFKGGTCLKKCYFDNYRFSEDLDFTVQDVSQLEVGHLKRSFEEIAEKIYEESGIETIQDTIRFETYRNLNKGISVRGCLNYRGPLMQRTNFPRLKIDLTADELVVLPPDKRMIFQNYSDFPKNIKIFCYALEEVFAEKIRALLERARPRDLYDVIHLYKHKSQSANKNKLVEVLKKKCDYKKIDYPSLSFMKEHPDKSILQSEWSNMLKHQLPSLEPIENYWNQLPKIFGWLFDDV